MTNKNHLLIEIGTEELPPKSLKLLSDAFTNGIIEGFKNANLSFEKFTTHATPRRLALQVINLDEKQADKTLEKRGPALKSAFDSDGNPSKAALGFAKSCGTTTDQLTQVATDKGTWLYYTTSQPGQSIHTLIETIITNSINTLPIPKKMRWHDFDYEFVRPVHWLVVLYGHTIIDIEVLGIKSGKTSYGHRFHSNKPIEINEPLQYESLLQQANVLSSISKRQANIKDQINELARQVDGQAIIDDDLLSEVTSLVEWPVGIIGNFDHEFLKLPKEVLISSMQKHQKYFPVMNTQQQLLPHFITISNIDSLDNDVVKQGNERVIRPRLSDAAFFWQQDLKLTLEDRTESLKKVLFQNKIGTLYNKSINVSNIAKYIAEQLNENPDNAIRASLLSKTDLMTEIVGEFPDLQGIMGQYYAIHDGEPTEVSQALNEQYMPRFSGDQLPATITGNILSLADKLDTLSSIFSIGLKPTGDKDPYGLRRSSLGILRILIEKEINIDLKQLLLVSAKPYTQHCPLEENVNILFEYIKDRMIHYFTELDFKIDIIQSVISCSLYNPLDIHYRLKAVKSFINTSQASSLTAANKRIKNILKKINRDKIPQINPLLFDNEIEKLLYNNINSNKKSIEEYIQNNEYSKALSILADLNNPINNFFDNVMVMDENKLIRNNRLSLLNLLTDQFLKIADISKLQSK